MDHPMEIRHDRSLIIDHTNSLVLKNEPSKPATNGLRVRRGDTIGGRFV